MQKGAIVREMWGLFSGRKWEEAKRLFHPELEVFYPQTQERFMGPDNFVGMNDDYPGHHVAEIRNLVEGANTVACTVFIKADTGQTAFGTSYFEFKEGRISKMTEYWGELYPAPESRAKWRVLA